MRLVAEALTSVRGGRTLYSGLSFAVAAGEALLLTGPNGAGKTTLLRTIAGLLAPATGRLWLEPADPERTLGEECHYVGHLNAVKASLTVAENVTFWCGFLGEAHNEITPALAAFGLAGLEDIPAAYLSAGQKRRLGLARLLVARRPVWLLDEPAVSLDQASQALLGEAVKAHRAAGGLVVAATHTPLGFPDAHELRLGVAGQEAASAA